MTPAQPQLPPMTAAYPFEATINDESVQVDRDGAGRISVTRNRPGLHAHAFVIGDEQHAFYADTPATATRHAHAWAAKHRPGQPVEPVR